jgi:sec-independent protein translocase protein TatC
MTTNVKKDPSSQDDTEQPFIYHLIELRNRLLRIVLVVTVITLALMPFSNFLFSTLSGPLTSHLPKGSSMIAIEVASPFVTPIKLTLVVALFIAMPYVLYQIWAFVAPGLYEHERRLVLPLLVSSTVLFYTGAAANPTPAKAASSRNASSHWKTVTRCDRPSSRWLPDASA